MSRLVTYLLLLAATVYGRHEKYQGHQVYRIDGPAKEIVALDAELDILSAAAASKSNFNQLQALVRLSPEEQSVWLDYFEKHSITYSVIIENLAAVLQEEDAHISKSRQTASRSNLFSNEHDVVNDDDSSRSSSENSSESSESSESGSNEDSTTETDSNEDSNEDGSDENGSSGDSTTEAESNESSSEDNGSQENSTTETDSDENGTEENGSQENSTTETDSNENGSDENGTEENGSQENSTTETDSNENGTEENGSQENSTTETDSNENGSEDGGNSEEDGNGDGDGDGDSGEQNGSDEDRSSQEETGWSINWQTFYRHQEINDLLDELGRKYPDLVTVINPALTYEGRQIKYVRISTSRFEDRFKPLIVVNAGVHAREWMTTSVALYIINQLVVDIVDSDLVQRLDWVIIPLGNPDGYEWSIDEDRLWRKTRSRNHPGADACPGVDIDRNYAHYWGTTLIASAPCSEEYEGPASFSEPETRVLRDLIIPQLERTHLYISMQYNRADMILYSWAQNGTLPVNGLSLHLAAFRVASAISNDYTVGNAGLVLSLPTGTSLDWTRANGVLHTYIFELPSAEGVTLPFLAPPETIMEISTKSWEGIAEAGRYIISIYN